MAPLKLVAPDNVYPAAWDVMAHFGTKARPAHKPPFEFEGRPVDGAALTTRLHNLGMGPIPATVRGLYVPKGREADRDAYKPWEMSGEFTLTITTQTLADFVYARAREFIATFPPGQTPPVVYATEIEIGREEEEEQPPETIYIDRQTGALVERETWERSRRAIRAIAKRKGTRPRTGRYVRVKV